MKKLKTLILIGILGAFMASAAGCELTALWNASPNGEQNTVLEHMVPEQTKTYNNNAFGTMGTGKTQKVAENSSDIQKNNLSGATRQGTALNSNKISREDREMIKYFMRNFRNGEYTNISDSQRQIINDEYSSIRNNRSTMRSSDTNDRAHYESLINGSYNNILNYARDYYRTNNIDYNALRSGRNTANNNTVNNVPFNTNNVTHTDNANGRTRVPVGNNFDRSNTQQPNGANTIAGNNANISHISDSPVQIPKVVDNNETMSQRTTNMPNVSGSNQSLPSNR